MFLDKMGEYQDFPSKKYWLIVPKQSAVNPSVLCFRTCRLRKFMDERGGVTRFSVKIFCDPVPKIFVGESFTVALISGIEKLYASEGCHNFQSKLFCLTVPKNFEEEHFCAVFQKISVSEKVYG